MEEKRINHMDLRPSDALLSALDNWRVSRRPVPSRSAAARVLIEDALAAEGFPVGGGIPEIDGEPEADEPSV